MKYEHVVFWLNRERICLQTYIFTSQDFSWLQKGQLNCLSSGSCLLLGAGFRLDLRLPILTPN